MEVTREAFHHFMVENGDRRPYNEVPCTRLGFRCNYLMLCSAQHGVSPLSGEMFVAPTSCFHKMDATHLIISDQDIPLTHDAEHVCQCMENWGRIKDPNWYHECMGYLWSVLNNGNDDTSPCRVGLIYQCLYMYVRDIVRREMFDVDTRIDLITDWATAYFDWSRHITKDMWELVYRSET